VAEPDDTIADLLIQWEEAWERGEHLSPSELCVGRPDLLSEIESRISALKEMAWLAKDPTHDHLQSDSTAQAADLPAILANRYRLEALIAKGGFGQVWKAFDSELQRFVAVKLPRIAGTQAADTFLSEARKLAALKSSGIVTVHDVGRDGNWTFIVSDLIEGQNLADRIVARPPTVKESIRIVAQVAESLSCAHHAGFIHRDIKPANILLDQAGHPHITDFGIAITNDELLHRRLASSGTLAYMAPEQLTAETQLVDHRADIYSLGVVLYQLLTGQLPFVGQTPANVREHILFFSPRSLREINSLIPKGLERICLRCLEKHPSVRYSASSELADDLRSFSRLSIWRTSVGARRALFAIASLCGLALLLTAMHFHAFFVTSAAHQNASGSSSALSSSAAAPTQFVRDGVFVFDGTTRIVTSLERFAPVTLEAWLRTKDFRSDMFLIGSDIPNEYGIGFGVKAGYANVEILQGGFLSQQQLKPGQWCHIAVVYGTNDTTLYVNGKKVRSDRPTQAKGGTNFVVGNVGEEHTHMFFRGEVRSLRISTGERYRTDFQPPPTFPGSDRLESSKAVLIYEPSAIMDNRVIDQSGNGHDGRIERLTYSTPE
jgi:eukaryotic-like serine/threonine-protein kinase